MGEDNKVITVSSKDPNKVIKKYLLKVLQDSIRDAISNGDIFLKEIESKSDINPCLFVQFYYNTRTNKAFIEYDYNDIFRIKYNTDNVTDYINYYIKNNFEYNTFIYPEIIMMEDGVNERCDSSYIITPYTIAYWKCLSGVYEFITDQTEIFRLLSGINIPSYSNEYYEEKKEIYDSYFKSNFSKFEEEMNKLNTKYKISVDKAPDKKFEDFIDLVKELNQKYIQTSLSEEDKESYINEYKEIYHNNFASKDLYKKIEELNKKYNILPNRNECIPEIFEEYSKLFYDFFDAKLIDISDSINKFYVEIKE